MLMWQVLRDSGATVLLQLVRLVGGLLLLPVLLDAMGPYAYGFVALGISLCTYSVMLESILTPVLRNRLNISIACGDQKQVARLENIAFTASCCFLIGATLFFTLIFIFVLAIELTTTPYLWLAVACAVTIIVAAVGGVVDCLFSALDKLWLLRIWELVGTIVGFICAIFLARAQADAALVLGSIVLIPILPKIWAWVRQVKNGNVSARVDFFSLKEFVLANAQSSRDFFVLQLILCILSTFPSFFITHQLGLVATTLWSTAQRVMAAPSNFLVVLIPVAWPRITRAYAARQLKLLERVFWWGGILLIVFLVLWTIVIIFFGSAIFGFLTANTVFPSVPLLAALGGLVVVNACGAWVSGFLNAFGEFTSQMQQALITLMLTLILVPIGKWVYGMPGIIGGMLVAAAFCGLIPTTRKVLQRLEC